jgi:hypothetical protein
MEAEALHNRINALADDIGRLQRHTQPDTSLAHLCDRLASHAQALHTFVTPSAGQLAAWYAPGDDQAVQGALETVDAWDRAFCARLKVKPT